MSARHTYVTNLCALLFAFLPLLLFVDWPYYLEIAEPPPTIDNKLTDEQRSFLLKQYDTAVKEIQPRIEQEHLLFVLKFTLVGAALGLLFRDMVQARTRKRDDRLTNLLRSPTAAALCWAAVGIAAIVDVRLLFNIQIISDLGTWVRALEQALLPARAGWETFFKTQSLIWTSPVSPLLRIDRQLVTWALYLTVYYTFAIRARHCVKNDHVMLVARVALPTIYVLFALVGLFHYGRAGPLLILGYAGFALFLAGAAYFWITWLWRRAQKAAADAVSPPAA